MQRLLCITANLNTGGAETFLMKIYRALDRDRYQMDFCVVAEENYYEGEIEKLGGKLYHIPLKSKHPVSSFNEIRRIVSQNGYKSVMRVNQHSLSTLDLMAARIGGADKLIMRSSNASSGGGLPSVLHKAFRPLTSIVPNVRFAPSKLAAEYSFGRGCIESGKAFLIPNGLDINNYRFCANARDELRKELGLEGMFVVGHIGRFNHQKNHAFLIDSFARLAEEREDAALLLVGNGVLMPEVKEKVAHLGLCERVRFLGVRSDVNCLLSAMDVLALPSFYEGMPNVVIEAQVSGLPSVVSDRVTEEANVAGIVEFASIDAGAEDIWALAFEKVSHLPQMNRDRYAEIMKQNGYDIEVCAAKFTEAVFAESDVKGLL